MANPGGQELARSDQPGLIGLVERLLGASAIAAAVLYVLITALYVEFYDDFGVRPEDVGWDRLTILARSAWLALVLIPSAAVLAYTVTIRRLRDLHKAGKDAANKEAERDIDRLRQSSPELTEAAAQAAEAQIRGAKDLDRHAVEVRAHRSLVTARAVIIAALVVILGFAAMKWRVEIVADAARRGENVNGVRLLIPIIDLQSNRAVVTWLGDEDKRPTEVALPPDADLDGSLPYLTYLGRGDDVAAFLLCGRETVLLPAQDIQISLLSTEARALTTEEQLEFDQACP